MNKDNGSGNSFSFSYAKSLSNSSYIVKSLQFDLTSILSNASLIISVFSGFFSFSLYTNESCLDNSSLILIEQFSYVSFLTVFSYYSSSEIKLSNNILGF